MCQPRLIFKYWRIALIQMIRPTQSKIELKCVEIRIAGTGKLTKAHYQPPQPAIVLGSQVGRIMHNKRPFGQWESKARQSSIPRCNGVTKTHQQQEPNPVKHKCHWNPTDLSINTYNSLFQPTEESDIKHEIRAQQTCINFIIHFIIDRQQDSLTWRMDKLREMVNDWDFF